ncbi:hypothetical protein [Tunturiibacter gelidiferens]|uniref:hypothetical protein n=1 Tax=Tunturiibacter gelidiferens TaxID=3069689 RepID=UPI003D9B4881
MRIQISRTLQYLYFLRFSLILWLFPPVFALADWGLLSFSTRTLTRGIFVPEYWSGYLAFYLVASGFVALATARTTVINGKERFAADRPNWLVKLLANDAAQGEVWPVFYSLIPTILIFVYLVIDGFCEEVDGHAIALGLAIGTQPSCFGTF